MRRDSVSFNEHNIQKAKTPSVVVRVNFSLTGEDYVYFTSNSSIIDPPVDGVIHYGLIHNISSSSQKMDLSHGINTIGDLSFSLTDKNSIITDLLGDKLASLKGIRNREVRVYYGFEGMSFNNYIIIQTQKIDRDVTVSGATYTFNCSDIQRDLTATIFDPAISNLARSITATDTEIFIYPNDGVNETFSEHFNDHGPSYSDAPSQKVFYIKIDKEAIRCIAIVADATLGEDLFKITVGSRGVLGTAPIEHVVDSSDERTSRPSVSTMMYIELPTPKAIYAIMTGVLYNEPGKVFPASWSAGLLESHLRVSDFTGIGTDLWNPADDTVGNKLRFIGEGKVTAKQFIEEQLMKPLGLTTPIYGTGKIGLKKGARVSGNAPHVAILNDSNVKTTTTPVVKYDLSSIKNALRIMWGWDHRDQRFEKQHIIYDENSQIINDVTNLYTEQYRGIHPNSHTLSDIKNIFDSIRDRFGGPGLYLTLDLQPSMNALEVGDPVRVTLAQVRDYTGTIRSLDRVFEVQQVTGDWLKGNVTVQLFGSSLNAAPFTEVGAGNSLADSYFDPTPDATHINLNTVTGAVLVGDTLHLTSAVTLTGNTNVDNAVYFYPGNVTINSGVQVNWTQNVFLRIGGLFTNLGTLNGKGAGATGYAGVAAANVADASTPEDTTDGYFGVSHGQAGFTSVYQYDDYIGRRFYYINSTDDSQTRGKELSTVPYFSLIQTATTLSGYPTDLRGCPGAGGIGLSATVSGSPVLQDGGDGGNGGGGLLIVCRGMDNDLGVINSSGDDGVAVVPVIGSSTYPYVHAGAGGGGAPGVVVVFIDGDNLVPTLDSTSFVANSGVSPYVSVSGRDQAAAGRPTGFFSSASTLHTDFPVDYYAATKVLQNTGNAVSTPVVSDYAEGAHRIQFLKPIEAIAPSTRFSYAPSSLGLTVEYDTPRTPKGNVCTITADFLPGIGDAAYSYSNVYVRVAGTYGWGQRYGFGVSTFSFPVTADGTTYEVLVKSVSKQGVESDGGLSDTITIGDIESTVSIEPVVIDAIRVPNVTGLEIYNQGNDTVFGGREIKLTWNKSSLNEWYNLGYEPLTQGAGAGGEDLYFKDYRVRVYDTVSGDLLREEFVTDTFYLYSHEKNAEDHADGIPTRYIRFDVDRRSRQNQYSERSAKISVSNDPPVAPTGVIITPLINGFNVTMNPTYDIDYSNTECWISETPGFTPSDSTLTYSSKGRTFDITGLGYTTYYIVLRDNDEFGPGSYSTEYSVTTLPVSIASLDTTPPDVPTGLSASSTMEVAKLWTKSRVNATWNSVTDATKYIVKYHSTSNATDIEVVTSITSFQLDNAIIGDTYTISVAAVDAFDNASAFCVATTIAVATDTSASANVSAFTATAGLDKVILGWVNPTSSNYLVTRIYRGTTSGFTPSAGNMIYEARGDAYIDSEITNGTPYYYKSSTVTVSGVESTFSAYVTATPFKLSAANVSAYFESASIGDAYITTLDAAKITTGYLAAARIQASTITADKLSVSTLSAITANMGTITAGTITGATTQTASSGARVVLSSTGIAGYDATTQRLSISNTGSGWIGSSTAFAWTSAGVVTTTGIVVRSSASTARTQLDDVGLRSWDSGGVQRVNIATDGSGYLGNSAAFVWTAGGAITATGLTIQSATTAAKVLINSSGIAVTNASSVNMFNVDPAGATTLTIGTGVSQVTVSSAGLVSVPRITATIGSIGGFSITSSSISSIGIGLDQTARSFWINNNTFGTSGIQLDYNGGSPRLYAGNGSSIYLKYTSSGLETQNLVTATSGTRITINESGTNLITFYDDVGSGNEMLIKVGTYYDGTYNSLIRSGTASTTNTKHGVLGQSYSGHGIVGLSTSGNGVYASSASGVAGNFVSSSQTAVVAVSSSYYGIIATCGTAVKAPLLLTPRGTAAPTHSSAAGSLYVSTIGGVAKLYINTDGATTWQLVGSQT